MSNRPKPRHRLTKTKVRREKKSAEARHAAQTPNAGAHDIRDYFRRESTATR